ncbi:hypothetical protein SAMN02745157_2820 [Kaistia soli DSM 19436]|uniref:Uncharacterized protein n=1 Tax=Kaistia soli DSM 19436 TaxID=1122133 RepID=A0A1M5DX20_9HYPH|nr:hypothetical protein [Kaistia soli]SHF71392.1 hypothetical protein SAMN02745157_2820 [Kaistia soli DSM 19436]
MRLIYIDAPAGSGKTRALTEKARWLAHTGDNVLFVQPTKELIDRTIERQLASNQRHTRYEAIYSDDERRGVSVSKQIIERLKSGFDGGGVLFITHVAFLRLKWHGRLMGWHLMIDEVPTAFQCFEHTVPETHRILTDLITPGQSDIAGYPFAVVRDGTELRKMARNGEKDEVWAQFQAVASVLESTRWLTYLHGENFDGVRNGTMKKLLIFSLLQPSICDPFDGVTIAAANFRESMLFRLWSRQGVAFVENSADTAKLNYRSHENGRLLTIHYAYDGRWSKTGKGTALKRSEFETLMDLMVGKLRNRLGDQHFLWVANKGDPDNLFNGMNGLRLPNVPHGLNEFQDYNCVVFLSALRLSNPVRSWFEAMGISAIEIDAAIHMEAAYQAIARSSLRSENSVEHVHVYLPDLATAEWLQTKFPESTLDFLDWIPERLRHKKKAGRPRIHENDNDRRSHSRRKIELCNAISATEALINNRSALLERIERLLPQSELIGDETIYIDDNNVAILSYGMRFDNVKCSTPKAVLIERSEDQFIERLRQYGLVQARSDNKKKMEAISPAIYDAFKAGQKRRGRQNIEFVSGVWIDVDRISCGPDNLSDIFRDCKFAIFNSVSNIDGKWRLHLYFPTKTIMPPESYKFIAERLATRIHESVQDAHVEDKLAPTDLFLLPCLATDSSGNYFRYFNDAGRTSIDVQVWLQAALDDHLAGSTPGDDIPFVESPTIDPTFPRNDVMIEKALTQWAQQGWKPGSGNEQFLKLALKLVRAGVDDDELQSLLRTAAGTANSPDDRRASIEGTVKSVRRFSKQWTV